jgi:hypothetical protein
VRKADFVKMLDEEFEHIRKLHATKGEEYTRGSDDQLINFKRRSEESGIRPEQAWNVLAGKHHDAILSWIHDGEVKSDEPIEGRIRDLILYLYLLQAMVRVRNALDNLYVEPEEEITGSARLPGPIPPIARYMKDGEVVRIDLSALVDANPQEVARAATEAFKAARSV